MLVIAPRYLSGAGNEEGIGMLHPNTTEIFSEDTWVCFVFRTLGVLVVIPTYLSCLVYFVRKAVNTDLIPIFRIIVIVENLRYMVLNYSFLAKFIIMLRNYEFLDYGVVCVISKALTKEIIYRNWSHVYY